MMPRTREKAEKVAIRRNKKNAKRWPLLALAGALEHVTADDILNADARSEAKWREDNEKMAARARVFRQRVATLISGDELASLDQQRLRYPSGQEYAADFWRGQLRKLGGLP